MAQLQRKLQVAERGDMNTLIATMYIKSDENTAVNIFPYMDIPQLGTAYLGFGQDVETNRWVSIIWREVVDSNDGYTRDFFTDLTAVRDKYSIKDFGYLRLAHILAVPRGEGTTVGFKFRLLSDQPVDQQDVFTGQIYVSSLTFLP